MAPNQIIVITLTLISLTCLSLVFYLYKLKKLKYGLFFSFLILFLAIFTEGSYFGIVFLNITTAILWKNISQIIYLLTMPTLLILILKYIGNNKLLKPINILIIYILPIIGSLLRITDQYNHFMRKEVFLSKGHLVIINTQFATIYILFERMIIIFGIFMLVEFLVKELVVQNNNKKLIPIMNQLEIINTLKDKLFTIVTHDIRGPLTVMVSLTQILEAEKEHYSKDVYEIIETVKEYIYDTYGMAENLLKWISSQKKGLIHNPLTLKLSVVLEEILGVYGVLAQAKNINIINQVDENIIVYADEEMLKLVLRNVLSNAIKFSRVNGIITLNASEIEVMIVISVSDTGIGIKDKKSKTIFSDKQENKNSSGEEPTSIGLLLCKEFIQYNGGDIWMESVYGKGSVFYISIPSDCNR